MKRLLKLAEFLCKLSLRRQCSQVSKSNQTQKNRKYIHKIGNHKKYMGNKIPLPDVNGEVLCGIHPVQAALQAGKRQAYTAFFMVGVYNERVNMLREECVKKEVKVIDVKGYVLDNLSGNHPHQGVCLDVSKYTTPLLCLDTQITSENLYSHDGKPNVWVFPFHIKDTMNMGAILRSSYYLGVNKVLLPSCYSSALNPVVSKASAGALEVMDIQSLKHDNLIETCLMKWREVGGIVVGSTGDESHNKSLPLYKFSVDKPTLLIIGILLHYIMMSKHGK